MKKNIIIVEDSSKFHYGGGQKITLEVAALVQRNCDLFLFDCRRATLFQEKIGPIVKEVFPLACFGRFIQSRRSSFNIGIAELLLTAPLLIYNIVRVLRFLRSRRLTKDNTILYAASKKSILLAYLIKKIRGIDYLYHAHTIDDRRSLLYPVLEFPLRSARHIICVSQAVMKNIDLPQCSLVYNPVRVNPQTRPRTLAGKQRIIVASFSSLIELKGIAYFMQSHQYLRNRERVDYWIFGEGPEKKALRQYESRQLILKGFADNVNDILAQEVDIVVAPSLVEESFGMIIAEAMANGIPVITTDKGAQAELISDGIDGYQVPVRDAGAIADRIDHLVESPDTYSRLSEKALERAAAFDTAIFERKILDLFGHGLYD